MEFHICRPFGSEEEGSRAPPLIASRTYYAGPCIGRRDQESIEDIQRAMLGSRVAVHVA